MTENAQAAASSVPLSSELKHIKKHCFYSIVLCFLVICLGSGVRSNDAGLSCPDWPLCYGKLIPLFDLQIFLEWFHRLLAAVLSIYLIYMTYLVLRLKPLRDLFEIPLYAALGLLLVQIILGGLTVLQLIDPGIVSLHLFNAILFLGVLLWIHAKAEESLRRRSPVATPRTKSLFYLGLTFIILLLAQIFLGGMVSTNFAGTVCPDFPACFGNWWPRGSYLINLQMGHRYLGFLLTAVAILFSILGIGYPGGTRIIHAVRLLPVLIIAQIALGVVNVLYSLPKWSSLLHLANAVFMFIIAALAAFELAHQAFTPRPKQAIKDAHT